MIFLVKSPLFTTTEFKYSNVFGAMLISIYEIIGWAILFPKKILVQQLQYIKRLTPTRIVAKFFLS